MIKQESFFGSWNKENKQYWVDTMQEHQAADRLRQGAWLRWYGGQEGDFKGCFFGCAMKTEDDTLEKATKAMGLPEWFIHLAERIFENLSKEESLTFPVKLLKAIPVDTDLSIVKHKTSVLRLTPLAKNNPEVSEVIEDVIKLHQKVIDGVEVSKEEWLAAESAAAEGPEEWSEEWLAARAAAMSAECSAEWSAYSDSDSAAYSAEEAVEAAAWSAEEAAEEAAWEQEADNLIKTLEDLFKLKGGQ